jgi:hypothetical protein
MLPQQPSNALVSEMILLFSLLSRADEMIE